MDFRVSFTIPASTPITAPVTQELKLTQGVISRVRIAIPAGHHGLAHLRIYRWEHQIYPYSPGADYVGDDEGIVVEDAYPLEELPYIVKLWGYNTDDTYPHTFHISLTVIRLAEALTPPTGAAAIFAALGA